VGYTPFLLSTWVKSPPLKGKKLAIVAACLPFVNKSLFEEIAKDSDRVVLLACPEKEPALHYGKIASMIRSTRPSLVEVYSIDGSPHCFTLHASVNEAEYILGEKIPRKHYVIIDGSTVREISPDAVRVARYLHIVDEIIKKHPEVLEHLEKHSLEYQYAKKLNNHAKRAERR